MNVTLFNTAKEAIKKTGLHRPLRKFISSSYRREFTLARQLIKDIRQCGFEQICQKHSRNQDNSRKYLDLECHVPEAVRNARKLELLDSKPLGVLESNNSSLRAL